LSEDTRIVSPDPTGEDVEKSMRPKFLSDFTGQRDARGNLEVYIAAARERGESLDHVLFHGPPGLGKTTLAQILANELGVRFHSTVAPILAKPGDIAALLTGLDERDVLFIDEIHRLAPVVEEVLYSAMEDYQLDLMIGEGPTAKAIKIELPRFTLVGATTRFGMLSRPLQDRFGIPVRLEFYDAEELRSIVARGARLLGVGMSDEGALEIAARSRGTPRIAERLLRRVRDFAQIAKAAVVTPEVADDALVRLDVDKAGLDRMDRRYLRTIADNFNGGPVGAETLAAALSEPRDTIEDRIEPFLIQQGYLQRTSRGRMLARRAYQHLGLPVPANLAEPAQASLFAGG
jgi:Holliday junction DNA helicase RuvB